MADGQAMTTTTRARTRRMTTGVVAAALGLAAFLWGTADEHLAWWQARSTPVIAEVADKAAFLRDLRAELESVNTPQGIPFDTSVLKIEFEGK